MVYVKKMMATTLISANQWPELDDHKTPSSMASSPSTKPIDKTPPLNCPRCDSSNTKFCYYNNYSLSQPRHFCKACKRYWTRGGTLRNVPVGGGCRKNKRLKRPQGISTTPSLVSATANPSFYPNQIDNSPDPLGQNFSISSLLRVSSGFDLHPHGNLGFSSPPVMIRTDLCDVTIQQQKFISNSSLPHFSPYENEMKLKGENGSVWNPNPNPNPIDQISSSDPSSSSLLWNTSWFDPSTMDSSPVPSLI